MDKVSTLTFYNSEGINNMNTDNKRTIRLERIQNFINKGQLDHNVYTPEDLVKSIVDKLDVDNKKILVLYNLEIVVALIHDYNVDPSSITFHSKQEKKMELSNKGMGTNITKELDTDMKFDVVIGNPPYQDGNKEGGQNKIYNQFSKKSLDLGNVVAFITPSSVLKKSKRFSLIGVPGLKHVDFTANDHFNVGVKICSWIVDRSYTGDVEVIHENGTVMIENNNSIHDPSEVCPKIVSIYNKLMDYSRSVKDTDKRMFKRNNHGPAFRKEKTDKHLYTIYSNNRGEYSTTYSSRLPVYFSKEKIILSNTKALIEDNVFVDLKDYGPSYFCVEFKDNNQYENIKSFVLSEYFVELYKQFRQIRGGMNSVLIDYCPKFDTTKKWTNEEVKNFFENF